MFLLKFDILKKFNIIFVRWIIFLDKNLIWYLNNKIDKYLVSLFKKKLKLVYFVVNENWSWKFCWKD